MKIQIVPIQPEAGQPVDMSARRYEITANEIVTAATEEEALSVFRSVVAGAGNGPQMVVTAKTTGNS